MPLNKCTSFDLMYSIVHEFLLCESYVTPNSHFVLCHTCVNLQNINSLGYLALMGCQYHNTRENGQSFILRKPLVRQMISQYMQHCCGTMLTDSCKETELI